MSFKLPMRGTEAREMIDIDHLASLGAIEELMKLPTLHQAARQAEKFFQEHRDAHGGKVGRGTRVNYLVLRANGELQLVQFGPRGGHKVIWNFGNPLVVNGN